MYVCAVSLSQQLREETAAVRIQSQCRRRAATFRVAKLQSESRLRPETIAAYASPLLPRKGGVEGELEVTGIGSISARVCNTPSWCPDSTVMPVCSLIIVVTTAMVLSMSPCGSWSVCDVCRVNVCLLKPELDESQAKEREAAATAIQSQARRRAAACRVAILKEQQDKQSAAAVGTQYIVKQWQ